MLGRFVLSATAYYRKLAKLIWYIECAIKIRWTTDVTHQWWNARVDRRKK